MIRKERPRVRKIIMGLLRDGGFALEEIASGRYKSNHFSKSLQIQAKKMIDESFKVGG